MQISKLKINFFNIIEGYNIFLLIFRAYSINLIYIIFSAKHLIRFKISCQFTKWIYFILHMVYYFFLLCIGYLGIHCINFVQELMP